MSPLFPRVGQSALVQVPSQFIFRPARLSLQSALFLLVLPATKTSTEEDPGDVRALSNDAKIAYHHATSSSDLLFLYTTASI